MDMFKNAGQHKGMLAGKVTFETVAIETPEAMAIDAMLRDAHMMGDKFHESIHRLMQLAGGVRRQTFKNRVHLSGREVFSRILFGDPSYAGTGAINWGALGTGNGAINDADTTLNAEAVRKQIGNKTRSGDSMTFYFYYSTSDWDGMVEEFGTFIDGTASADSGDMYNRVRDLGWVKSATEALTVSVQFDINAET